MPDSLLFFDSYAHYNTSQGSRIWTAWNGGIGSTNGRGGRPGAEIGNPSMTFNSQYATLSAGTAYYTSAFANNIITHHNEPAGLECNIGHVGDGRLNVNVKAGINGATSSPSSYVMLLNNWYYFELKSTVTVGPENPSPWYVPVSYDYEVYVNEALIMSGNLSINADPRYIGARIGTYYVGFALQGRGGGIGSLVCDTYCTDGELLGDIKIGCLYPNATGDSNTWGSLPLLASPMMNYQNVLEHISDDDATILFANTAGLKDLYNMDNIPSGFLGTIKGVQALWLVKKSDAGSAYVKGVWKDVSGTEVVQSDGYNYLSPNGYAPSFANYIYNRQPKRKSLFTGADWTTSEINLMQLGIQRTV